MNADKAFIDANVLIYAHDSAAGDRHAVAKALVAALWETQSGVLSTQVLQELYVNLRRKLRIPMPLEAARAIVADYANWSLIVPDAADVLAAIDLEDRYQLSYWDSLIVRAAQVSGAVRLYTEDLQHQQQLGSVQVMNPFLALPIELST